MYLNKNIDRGYKDISLFEIGPVFTGKKPGDQITVVCGISTGKNLDCHGLKKRDVDIFDVKRDVIQTLSEAGYNPEKFVIDDETQIIIIQENLKNILNAGKENVAAYFGELHPGVVKH